MSGRKGQIALATKVTYWARVRAVIAALEAIPKPHTLNALHKRTHYPNGNRQFYHFLSRLKGQGIVRFTRITHPLIHKGCTLVVLEWQARPLAQWLQR